MDGEVIYNIINGFYDRNAFPVPEDMELEEMFQEGSESGQLLETMYQMKRNLCSRYNEDENAELETIFDCMEQLMQIVSLKMFDYGRMQADMERKNRKE